MKQQNKVDEPKAISFLAGARWAKGKIATDEELQKGIELVITDKWKKKFDTERANLLEASINRCALDIIKYSSSEWSNDYYDCANTLYNIMEFIDKNAEKYTYGKYFKL